jgi:hypothetical protein
MRPLNSQDFQLVYNREKDLHLSMNQAKHILSMKQLKEALILKLKFHRIFLFASLSILLVIAAYVWFISFGSWTTWPTLTNYYDQLASAFDHGKLSLELKPDAALLALANPYDPFARSGLPILNDASLYKGKYYLYFGPVPALFLAIIKPFGFGEIGDQYLVFVFVSGILILQALLVIKIWQRFFQDIPVWVMAICIFLSGLITPFASMLTKARVYEAAIACGQFFFLIGLYFIITALDKDYASEKHLLIGGISLALAIGSRLTQILPIGCFVAMVAFWVLRKYSSCKPCSKAIYPIVSLSLPLILGLAILGWYNWARFNSVFETGISYQLAWTDPQKNYPEFFSPLYLFQNLYNYLIIPPKFKYDIFPFMFAIYGKKYPLISSLPLPKIYNSEKITGLLYSVPFALYALKPLIGLFYRPNQQLKKTASHNDQQLLDWLIVSLLGCFLFGFASFLVFFWAAIRYFEDFLPALLLLSIIGFWQGYRYCFTHPGSRVLYLVIGICLIAISIIASTLLGLSFGSPRFGEFNPHLWNFLQQ